MRSWTPAFSSLGCPTATLDEALALAERHAIPAIELRSLASQMDLPAYFTATYGTPEVLAARLRGERVQVVALDTSFSLGKAGPADREKLLQFIPWAEALGIRWLRVFDGGVPNDEASFEAIVESLGWWQALRVERGWRVDVMIEIHDSLLTAAVIQRFLARCPAANLLWDTHHTWKKGGENPLVTWPAIKHRVVHIHIKDSVSKPSAQHPFTYVYPGEGEFPARALFDVLGREYRGVICLEWELLWHTYLPPLEGALVAAKQQGWW